MGERQHSLSEIVEWAGFLEDYALDWDKTFKSNANYFTQEYWYLLVRCTLRFWQGSPVNVTHACDQMISGSVRTREERIKRACRDGYLIKQAGSSDHREVVILPSEELQNLVKGHLERTLTQAISMLDNSRAIR